MSISVTRYVSASVGKWRRMEKEQVGENCREGHDERTV